MISVFRGVGESICLRKLNTSPIRAEILAGILVDVRNAVGLIEAGQDSAALCVYRSMTERVGANVR